MFHKPFDGTAFTRGVPAFEYVVALAANDLADVDRSEPDLGKSDDIVRIAEIDFVDTG